MKPYFFLQKIQQKKLMFPALNTIARLIQFFGLIWTISLLDRKIPKSKCLVEINRHFPYDKI